MSREPTFERVGGAVAALDECLLDEALTRYGTPAYVYDEATLLANVTRIREAVTYEGTQFHYALVANRAWRVLQTIAREGWRFHFNSPLEVEVVRRALAWNGAFDADEVASIIAESVFSGGSISPEEMLPLVEQGVFVHVTACDQLASFGAVASSRGVSAVGLRVQFDENMQRARQGVARRDLPHARALAARGGQRITSVHMYRGTDTQSAERFAEAFGGFAEIARQFPDLRSIDIGGGFGYDYETRGVRFDWRTLGAFVDEMMSGLNASFGRRLAVRLEVGRAVVASAGVFATRVLSRKPGFAEREVILGMDASSMSVRAAAPSVVGRRHHFRLQHPRPGRGAKELYTLVGPTTYTSDFLATRVEIAGGGDEGVQPGDVVLVLDCGAYGAVTHSEFLTTPRPSEVMVTAGGELIALAKRTGVEQITAHWA